MSGGTFDYKQHHIIDIADEIQSKLDRQGVEKTNRELAYFDNDYYDRYPEEKFYPTYPVNIQVELKNAVNIIRKAALYAQRVDYYFAGDDGEESFLRRLKQELNQLNEGG